MWNSNFIKWLYRLEGYFSATGVGNNKIVHALYRRGRNLMMRFLAQDVLLTRVHDVPMYIYPSSGAIHEYLLQPFEPYTTELFEQAIKPGATVLDIGAQFGYYSLIAAKRVGHKGRVYAFEPVPANFQLLLQKYSNE